MKLPLLFLPLLQRQQLVRPSTRLTERLPLVSPHSGQRNVSCCAFERSLTTTNVCMISCLSDSPIIPFVVSQNMKDLNAYISIAEESSKPTGKIPTFDRSAQVDLGEDMAKRL